MRLRLLLVAMLVASVAADMYLHYPPGSNGRNRERNDNRNNGNRLFDTQNNGKGGYAWRGDATANGEPDPLQYYVGSLMRFEWTNQHACGPNPNTHCDVVLQYACEDSMPGLRDGYPTSQNVVQSDNQNAGYLRREFSGEGGQNQDGTNTIPDNRYNGDEARRNAFYTDGAQGGQEFGYHEPISWYDACRNTLRNEGLYLSDQKLNRNDARATRQNPNGNRRGLECPEERDYYPYWRPTPFRDIAVLTSDTSWCPYFASHSNNVRPVGYCQCDTTCRNSAYRDRIPITQDACEAATGGVWVETAWNQNAPDCRFHDFGRDNHLGNTLKVTSDGSTLANVHGPEAQAYNWAVHGNMLDKNCIVRTRYNISTGDYDSMAYAKAGGGIGVGFDFRQSCPRITLSEADAGGVEPELITSGVDANAQCFDALTASTVPLYNRPYVDVFGAGTSKLSLAINTHQTGRTFQDRSHVFHVVARPPALSSSATVYNLNLRGRRGNIVQCYPAVEYDFVPQYLTAATDDFIHIQFHGSDYNAPKNQNNADGWRYSDRANIVQTRSGQSNYPAHVSQMTLFPDINLAQRWALLDQPFNLCEEYEDGDNNEGNSITNCGKLNRAPARYPPNPLVGLVQLNEGSYFYMSTRNNNFSNRSHKGSIFVSSTGLSVAAIVGISFGAVAVVGLGVAGVCFYGKRNPRSTAGGWYSSCASKFSRGGSSQRLPAGTAGTTPGSTQFPSATSTSKVYMQTPPQMEYQRH